MKSKENIRYIIFTVLVSTVLMTLSSMTSFIFPLHTGVDQNCFFTVGKSMLDGRVLYRDIFEQKGPLLYFIHMLGSLISKDTFTGVYIFQIINTVVIMLYMGKLSDMFLSSKYKFLVSSVSCIFIVTSNCYSKGDNAEEFSMTFILISLYYLCIYLKNTDRIPSLKMIYANGILAGAIFMIKYTILGFHIAWIVIMAIILIKRKNFKSSVIMCLVFLGGMMTTAIPFIIYFIANGALYDFYYVYFYSNIFLYSRSVSFISRIANIIGGDLIANFLITPIALWGLIWMCKSKKLFKNTFANVSILMCYLTLYFFIFIGGTRYRYYLLATSIFVVFGVIRLCLLFERIIRFLYLKRKASVPIAAVILLFFTVMFSNINGFYGKPKEYYPQVKFARIINETPDATILNYNFLDGGFFLMSHTPLPDTKYFCRVNILRESLPEMYEDQERSIEKKETEYVVARSKTYHDLIIEKPTPFLFENYELVAQADEDNDSYRYYLFKRK